MGGEISKDLEICTIPGKNYLQYLPSCDCKFCLDLKKEMEEYHAELEEVASAVLMSRLKISEVDVRGVSVQQAAILRPWRSEDYAVRSELVDKILLNFGVESNEFVDVFSTAANARFGKRIVGNARETSWSPPQVSWWNPPFSRLQDCVVKILLDDAQGIFIAPAWKSDWLALLQKLAKKEMFFEAGTEVFELHGVPAGPVR